MTSYFARQQQLETIFLCQLKRKKKPFSYSLSEIKLVKGEYHLEHFFEDMERLPIAEKVMATKKL